MSKVQLKLEAEIYCDLMMYSKQSFFNKPKHFNWEWARSVERQNYLHKRIFGYEMMKKENEKST